MLGEILKRLRSPVLWIAIIGLVYSTILVPVIPQLPDWTSIVGVVCAAFGIANNPCDKSGF